MEQVRHLALETAGLTPIPLAIIIIL